MFLFNKPEALNFDLKAENTSSGRLYKTPTGKKYPSVTTVLSSYGKKELFEWRERVGAEEANKIAGRASRRGTALHTVCEKYLLNEMTSMKLASMLPTTKELFYKIKSRIDTNITTVHCLEQALYSDELQIAGRVDCIAEWNGKLSVVDFKSSTNQKKKEKIGNYFMQCTAYAIMYEEIVGVPIEQIVVLIGTENGDGQVFVENKSEYVDSLKSYVKKHYDSQR
jgi:genome maintenance exonuclease 1